MNIRNLISRRQSSLHSSLSLIVRLSLLFSHLTSIYSAPLIKREETPSVQIPAQQNVCVTSSTTSFSEDAPPAVYVDNFIIGKQVYVDIIGISGEATNVELWLMPDNSSVKTNSRLTNEPLKGNPDAPHTIRFTFTAVYPPAEMRPLAPYTINATYHYNNKNFTVPFNNIGSVNFTETAKDCVPPSADAARQGAIAGGVIGGAIVVISIAVFVWYVRLKKQRVREMKGKFPSKVHPELWEDEYYETTTVQTSNITFKDLIHSVFVKKDQKEEETSDPEEKTLSNDTPDTPDAGATKDIEMTPLTPAGETPVTASLLPTKKKPKSVANPRPRPRMTEKDTYWGRNDEENGSDSSGSTVTPITVKKSVIEAPNGNGGTRRITVISGPPPRGTGGSSNWKPPAEKGRRYKALIAYKPEEADELMLERNDIVIIEDIFEDGWVKAFREGNLYFEEVGEIVPETASDAKERAKTGLNVFKQPRKDSKQVQPASEQKNDVVLMSQERRLRSGMVPFHYLVPARDEEVPKGSSKKLEMSKAIAITVINTR